MNFFKTLAMVGMVGVGMMGKGICDAPQDSAAETNPVISTHWEKTDFWSGARKPEEAEMIIVVSYSVPGGHDRDTHFLRPTWQQVRTYADGTSIVEVSAPYLSPLKTRCSFGNSSGVYLSGNPDVHPRKEGIRVHFNLRWSGKKTGEFKRDFLVPWSELEKTFKDDESEVKITVSYKNPSAKPQ